MTASNKNGIGSFRKRAISFFMKNLLKFAALVLALLIWWSIRTQFLQTRKPVEVRISVATESGEIPLGSPAPEKVTVFLQGNKSLLENISGNSLKIRLETKMAARKGTSCVWNLRPANVEIPFALGVNVASIEPDKISLLLDKMTSKKLRVEAVLDESQLPKGYKVGKVTVDPEEITVSAPSTKLEKIKTIRTLPVSLANITRTFDCDQGFDTESYSDLVFERKNVLVQVEILRAEKSRVFHTLPVRILIPPSSKKQTLSCEIVSSPTVDVQVSGAENVIDLLRKEDIFIFANISDFSKPGLYRIDLRCAIEKSGITASRITPPVISVKLEQISKR